MEILLGHHHRVFLMACEDDAVYEAYSREEVVLGNEVLHLCIHRMEMEAVESNKGLLRHDV